MVSVAKNKKETAEKEWEDPANVEKPCDERDKEQLDRLYQEAKRRKDNLTKDDESDKEIRH
jgi:hypothetical protein